MHDGTAGFDLRNVEAVDEKGRYIGDDCDYVVISTREVLCGVGT